MRVLQLLDNLNVIEFDVEVLVHGLEYAADRDIILQLHCHLLIHQRLEEAASFRLLANRPSPSRCHTVEGINAPEE